MELAIVISPKRFKFVDGDVVNNHDRAFNGIKVHITLCKNVLHSVQYLCDLPLSQLCRGKAAVALAEWCCFTLVLIKVVIHIFNTAPNDFGFRQ